MRSREHYLGSFDGIEEGVYVGIGSVDAERSSDSADNSETLHERLSAVMTGTDGDPHLVKNHADVIGVSLAEQEADGARVVGGLTDETHTADGTQSVHGTIDKLTFTDGDIVHAYAVDKINSGSQTYSSDIIGSAGLKLERRSGESGSREADLVNHLATAHPGAHTFEPLHLSIESSRTERTINFMTGESEEVTIKLLDIDRLMWDALSAIEQDWDALGMSHADNPSDIIDGAHDITDHGDTYKPGLRVEQAGKSLIVKFTGVGDRDDPQRGALTFAQELPGDYVGVMLHFGDDDLVATADDLLTEGVSYKIYGLGSVADEDDFGGVVGTDVRSDSLASLLIQVSTDIAEMVHAPVDVGIDMGVDKVHGIDDLTRLLSRCAIVEIDEWLVVYLFAENGEVATNVFDVEHDKNSN